MLRNDIDLNSLIAFGKASASVNKGTLDLITTNSIQFYGNSYKRHAIMLAQKYQLPFRIDFTAKIDFAFLIIVRDGHLTFGLSENKKIEDIAKPTGKPNQDNKLYNNKISIDIFVNISITYAFERDNSRFEMGNVITSPLANETIVYNQMDYYSPIKAKGGN